MSDLRQDLVSGDWIILATERAKRPHELLPKKKKRQRAPKSSCPFENLEKSGNWPPLLLLPDEKYPDAQRGRGSGRKRRSWRIAVIPNKYPALLHRGRCASSIPLGPYRRLDGTGCHELVITRHHEKNLAHMSLNEGCELFRVFQRRYQELAGDACLMYTSTFFNWGSSAGASLYHPHYQMLSLPIVPPDVQHSLTGSSNYFKAHRRCVHCDMLRFEEKSRKRIIAKDSRVVALAPFVSRQPFEIRIFPRRHESYFENISESDLQSTVAILQIVLRKMEKNLHDPDFNFFIHTAPLKHRVSYAHYHWHIEILPKISIPAGFELSTGVEINVVDPDAAAEMLKQ